VAAGRRSARSIRGLLLDLTRTPVAPHRWQAKRNPAAHPTTTGRNALQSVSISLLAQSSRLMSI
jgi:hypothetical protein